MLPTPFKRVMKRKEYPIFKIYYIINSLIIHLVYFVLVLTDDSNGHSERKTSRVFRRNLVKSGPNFLRNNYYKNKIGYINTRIIHREGFMFKYEFIDVVPEGSLKAGKTDTFERCKEIINEKAKEGWELVQIVPVTNEKWSSYSFINYTLVFKVNC